MGKKNIEHHISVVMPVYNRHKFLDDAIGSVLKQDYKNYELIIVNDGSTLPGINKILNRYQILPNVSIYHKKKNEGPGSAINFGATKVKGDHFCRVDSDDMIVPEALRVLNEYINKYPEVSYFYSSRYVIDENSEAVTNDINHPDGLHKSQKFNKEKLVEVYHCNHLICWKKKDFLDVGGMREDILWAEDWDMALRMSEKFSFQNIDEALYLVRHYPGKRLTCFIDEEMKRIIVEDIVEKARRRRSLRSSNIREKKC